MHFTGLKSILYMLFGESEKGVSKFDLLCIWELQKLENDLSAFMKNVMENMYKWMEKYKTSDDISESTKTIGMWCNISKSKEVKDFLATKDSLNMKKIYSLN